MQMQTMETLLSNELLEEEELIWSGQPAKNMASTLPSRILALVPITLGLVLMLVAVIIEILIGDFPAGRMSFLILPGFMIFALGGLPLFVLAQLAHLTLNSTLYAITNQRVLILYGSRCIRVQSFDRQIIKQVQRFEYPDGSGNLTFSCLPVSPGIYSSNLGKTGNQCIFRAIPHVHQVERKLLQVIKMGER